MSLTFNEATQAIRTFFDTVWADHTPFLFDNEQFKATARSSWVRFTIKHTTSIQETMGPVGGRNYTRNGIAILSCFAPGGEGGRDPCDLLAQKFRAGFEGVTDAGVRYHDCPINEIGVDSDAFYQMNAQATFDYTERR